MPTLVIDIGNTSTTLGLYYPSGTIRTVRRVESAVRSTVRLSRAIEEVTGGRAVERAVLATVVPAMKAPWNRALKRVGVPDLLWVHHRLNLGVGIDFSQPEQIGADRLANAAGAARRYGLPVVVADLGTALTFDVVLKRRGYCGGIIAPGLPLMFEYLAEKTAQLPSIEAGPVTGAYGRSTEAAMRIGAQVGYRGIVRELVTVLKKDIRSRSLTFCATGGHARWILKELDEPFVLDPHITLYGLGVIGELNGSQVS